MIAKLRDLAKDASPIRPGAKLPNGGWHLGLATATGPLHHRHDRHLCHVRFVPL